MDIKLKGKIDGIEAAGIIRSRFDIPSIFITAYSDDKILEKAKISEPFGYILKPFEKRELNCNIEMALYKHKAEKDREKLARERLEKERLAAITELAVTANHEINNPLTSVIGAVSLLKTNKDLSEDEKLKKYNTIHNQALRISDIVKRFLKIIKPVKTKYARDTEMIDLDKSTNEEWLKNMKSKGKK
jgi:signal transduction histidine kinase